MKKTTHYKRRAIKTVTGKLAGLTSVFRIWFDSLHHKNSSIGMAERISVSENNCSSSGWDETQSPANSQADPRVLVWKNSQSSSNPPRWSSRRDLKSPVWTSLDKCQWPQGFKNLSLSCQLFYLAVKKRRMSRLASLSFKKNRHLFADQLH